MIAAAAVAAALLLIAATWALRLYGTRHFRTLVRRRCVVTLNDGAWFSGVLWASDDRCVILRGVETESQAGPIAVDGEVVVLLGDVAYVQMP